MPRSLAHTPAPARSLRGPKITQIHAMICPKAAARPTQPPLSARPNFARSRKRHGATAPGLRGPRSEVRGPRSEVRGQRSEVRGPRSEVRGPRSEVRGPRSKVRGPRSEVSAAVPGGAFPPSRKCPRPKAPSILPAAVRAPFTGKRGHERVRMLSQCGTGRVGTGAPCFRYARAYARPARDGEYPRGLCWLP